MATSDKPETACERVMARYREALGASWSTADEMLFRGAWNEGAFERERQLRGEASDRVADLELRRDLAIEALRDDNDPDEALAILEGRKGTTPR